MADIETRLRRLLKVNAAVVGHLHVRSVLTRLAASALELTGAGYATVRVPGASGTPIEAIGADDAASRSRDDAVEVELSIRDEPFAVLIVAGHPSGAFGHDDIELLHSLAATAGIALDKARTYEATRQRERWAQAQADVRAAESESAAIAALLRALPDLVGAGGIAAAAAPAPGGAVTLTGPGIDGAVMIDAGLPLAAVVRAGRLDRTRAPVGIGSGDALVFPLREPGRAIVVLPPESAARLGRDELERVAELVSEAAGAAPPDAGTLGLYDELSPRERDVLLLIADGLSNRQIAERLFLSEKTVKNHVTALLRKMGMERRTQAAVYGAQLRDA